MCVAGEGQVKATVVVGAGRGPLAMRRNCFVSGDKWREFLSGEQPKRDFNPLVEGVRSGGSHRREPSRDPPKVLFIHKHLSTCSRPARAAQNDCGVGSGRV